ncbi:MAG: HAD-IIA family hydrolase [Actinomycetota bacterium]
MTGWALDLDGVIWRGTETIPGSPEAVAALRRAGVPIAFVTNSAQRTPSQVAAKLASHGIPDALDEVITAAMAAATMVERGDRVLAVGSDGVREALIEVGAELVDHGRVDAVVMGIDLQFSYDTMTQAMRAIDAGARFIATNTDATFPAADGVVPGNGALVASVATATGRQPEVAGKPHEPIAALVRDCLGSDGLMVGDRPETDGLFARSVGYRFGLVFSGVTRPDDLPVDPAPERTAADLATMVRDALTA